MEAPFTVCTSPHSNFSNAPSSLVARLLVQSHIPVDSVEEESILLMSSHLSQSTLLSSRVAPPVDMEEECLFHPLHLPLRVPSLGTSSMTAVLLRLTQLLFLLILILLRIQQQQHISAVEVDHISLHLMPSRYQIADSSLVQRVNMEEDSIIPQDRSHLVRSLIFHSMQTRLLKVVDVIYMLIIPLPVTTH